MDEHEVYYMFFPFSIILLNETSTSTLLILMGIILIVTSQPDSLLQYNSVKAMKRRTLL